MENIVVIGGGLMGSSAAWQLSQYGEKVLLIEQQSSTYKEGSSFGDSRISRSLGPKKDVFSFVQKNTVKETRKLLDFLNGISLSKKHKMSDIYATSPVTYIYDKSEQATIDKLKFKGQKDKFKQASGDAAFRKFGITVSDAQVVVKEYKKYSGTLNPTALIEKLQLGIKKHGNKIRYNHKAVKIVRKSGYYEIKTKHTKTGKTTIVQAKKIVLAAGPYTVPLLKNIAPYFKKLLIGKKVLLSFYKIDKKRYNTYTKEQKKRIFDAHPIFNQQGDQFFSMLDRIDKNGVPVFKVGGHLLRGNIPDLDVIWKEEPRKKELKWSQKQFFNYLRMLEIPIKKKELVLSKAYYCVYTMSRTKMPYVTPILTKERIVDDGIVVIGGMSGTGAKGCLAYGQLAADLLLNRSESTAIYKKTKKELGVDRLRKEVIKPFI